MDSLHEQSVYIFIGQSGCGKGTQIKLLEKVLRGTFPQISIFHLQTGAKFRELLHTDTYTGALTKKIIEMGQLPPPFLGVHMWAHVMIEGYDGKSTVFIDGTPRVPSEVGMLLSACTFYGWYPHVINLQVGDEWAYDKMKARGREDDKIEQDLWGRIEWFHTSVLPTIELLRESSLVTFHDIQGEQTIECVHADIVHSLGLSEDAA